MSRTPLAGRVALLTGASGGIGRAVATALAEAGADLALTFSSSPDPAHGVAEEVRRAGRRVIVLQADLADPATPTQLVAETERQLGPVELLVANAGAGEQRSWEEVDVGLWDATLAVNLRAPFLLVQAVAPGMVERGFGRILALSSVAAYTGGVVGPHYAASKAGLNGLVHYFAGRLAGDGVTVNGIAPALIEQTGMLPEAPDGAMPLPIPVGRLGLPHEVADLALAVLTNAYLTNQVMLLDGGLHPR
ncbi:MAG: 3-oxoacyl-[acyl-carrier protein] reductase [Kribbellaceae bacterium]|nr:3-oxoacyl-[acyl-carrier protein] reductase [Kribbellaceae bacterium]